MNAVGAADPIEARLRDALASLRPAEGAPAALRSRVEAVPDQVGRGGFVGWLGRLRTAPAVAVALAAGAGFVLLAIGLRSVAGPAWTGAPTASPTPFDPAVEGPGLVTTLVPTLLLAEYGIALSSGVTAAWWLARSRRSSRSWPSLVGALVAGSVAAAVVWLSSVQGVGVGGWNGWGPVSGFAAETLPGSGGDDAEEHTYVANVGPRQPFVFNFVVQNVGPVPVQLDGIVEDPDAASVIAPRWTALAFGTDPDAIGQPIDQLTSFQPVTLRPGEYVTIYVAGKTSECAAGPGYDRADRAYAVRGPDVLLAYSVLGLSATSPYRMPLRIAEPLVNGCLGQ